MNTHQRGFKCSCFLGNWNEVKKSKKTIAANHALIFTWMKSPALQSHPGHLWLLLLLKYSKRPALSGLCGNARCFPPCGAELLRPAFFSLFFFFFFFLNWLSVERKINNQILKEQHVKSTCISSQIPSTHGVLSVDKHSAVSGHIIFLFIFLAAYERSIHFPSHSPHNFLDKPVSALIVITTIEPCLANQVRLPKGHTYFMWHRIYLTKFFFLFPCWIEITPHISLDTRKAADLWSDGLYVLFMSSEHLLVRVSKISRFPEDSCLTGCKWTPKLRLKTTCHISSPPKESLRTAAEVGCRDLLLQ